MGHTAHEYEKLWVGAAYVLLSVARVWIATRSEQKVRRVCSIADRSEYSLPKQRNEPVVRRMDQRPDRRHWLCSLSSADKHIRHLLATGVLEAFDASGKGPLTHDEVIVLSITPSTDSALALDADKIEDANFFSGICLDKQKLLELFRPAAAFEEEFFAQEDWTGEMAAFYLEHRTYRGYLNEDRLALHTAAYQDLDDLLQRNKIAAFKNGRSLDRQHWFGRSVANDPQISLARSSILDALKISDVRDAEYEAQEPADAYADTLQRLFANNPRSTFNQAVNHLCLTHGINKKKANPIVEKDGRFKIASPGRPKN